MKKIPRPSNFMLMCAAAVLLNWLLSTDFFEGKLRAKLVYRHFPGSRRLDAEPHVAIGQDFKALVAVPVGFPGVIVER